MNHITLNGIIIRDKELGERDKVIKIFTAEKGIISAIVKRGQSIKFGKGSIAQILAYCRFSLFEGKSGFVVNEIEIKELFWGVRENLESLALAQYFCELCISWIPDEEISGELLRLFLNTLYYLSHKKKSLTLLKSIFELRGCVLCGYMPDLLCCNKCRKFESESMIFFVRSGNLNCKSCASIQKKSDEKILSSGVLLALRHIVYADADKIFSFSVSEESEKQLGSICEEYIAEHIGVNFKSLNFYKSLIQFSR